MPVGMLNKLDADEIVKRLTKPDSEFQREVMGRTSSSQTRIALVRSGSWRIAAWAASHQWRGMQTLEGFTLETARRRGFARLAAAALVADGEIMPVRPLAVFAPHCVDIAKSVGCRDVRLYERHGDDWIETT